MTTGSLKFVSLLVVIAAGGGVAWQVQQSILHTPNRPAETVDDDDRAAEPAELADDAPAWEDDESKRLLRPARSDRPSPNEAEAVAEAPRRDDDLPEITLSESRPNKFQRTPAGQKSLGTAIPARKAVPSDLKTDEDPPAVESTNDDPFAEKTASVTQSPLIRRSFEDALDEDDAPVADGDALALEATSEPEEADPFGDGQEGVMLAGDERPNDVAVPSLSASESTADDADGDDPFSGAAPPDFGDAPSSDGANQEKEEPAVEGNDGPSLFPTRRNSAKSEPVRSPAAFPEANPFDGNGSGVPTPRAEPQPVLGSPSDAPVEAGRPERRPPREERAPRSRKTPSAAKEEVVPRLLPVPDSSDAHDPAPTLPVDAPSESPSRPERQPDDRLGRDDLRGDGTPDRAVPKGMLQPRLTIEKVAPKQAVLGQPLIYSVVVKNVGAAEAHQVTVEDRIPKGTRLEGTSPRAELIDKKLVWRLGTLKPDEQKKISIKVVPLEQGPIGSVAKVNFVAEIAAEIEVTAPQIVLQVTSPSQVRLGEKLPLVFQVRNTGGADALNVVIRNLIPEGLRHPAGADLEYAIGTLPARETREIKLEVVAVKIGKVTNKAIVTAEGGLQVEEETPVEVVGEQLLLTRTGKNRLFIDKPAVFTSTVANEGTAPAAKVMVAEIVPAGFEFIAASDNGKFDPSTRAVTWSVGPIAPGEELKLSTRLLPKQLGDYRATVTVTGPAGGVATVDAELKVDGFPAVAIESKSDSRLISVGEQAAIRIACKNQGTSAATNVVLSAELPPELKLLDAKGPSAWSQQGNVVTFEAIATLDANDSATFEIQVEGLAEGDSPIELQISADHLKRPLHRDEPIRVAP